MDNSIESLMEDVAEIKEMLTWNLQTPERNRLLKTLNDTLQRIEEINFEMGL